MQILDRTLRMSEHFLKKLWEKLSDSQYSEAIKWTNEGNGFIVNMEKMNNILPSLLRRGKKIDSFRRQLNNYGFKFDKSVSDSTYRHYTHDQFHRDKPDALSDIIKNRYKLSSSKAATHTMEKNLTSPASSLKTTRSNRKKRKRKENNRTSSIFAEEDRTSDPPNSRRKRLREHIAREQRQKWIDIVCVIVL